MAAAISSPVPTWRCFRSLPSDSEAASVSAHCKFSLSTLEVACSPAKTSFALIEQEEAGIWRWAILDADGVIVVEGGQPTQEEAKETAVKAFARVMS